MCIRDRSIIVVTVAAELLPILTYITTFVETIAAVIVPNIDPVAIADSSTTVTVVPSCISRYLPT